MAPRDKTKDTDPATTPATPASTEGETMAAEAETSKYASPIPAEYANRPGIDLLMEACTLYGIDPDANAYPVQLLDWKFKTGDQRRGIPDRITLVTAGGLKLAHPADEDTIERLRRTFKLFKERKQKDGSIEIEVLPLPADLALPSVHVTGQIETDDHQYRKGYLREGGAAEATRREARRRASLP